MDTLCSGFFYLAEFQLDRRGAPENHHGYAHTALFVVDIFHSAVEVRERTFLDAHHLTHHELDLVARLVGTFLHLTDDLLHFVFRDGSGAVLGALDKSGDLAGVFDQMPGVIVHDHFDKDVTRKKTPLGRFTLTVLHLNDFFRRHQDTTELVLHSRACNTFSDVALYRLLHTGVGMNDVPTQIGIGSRSALRSTTQFNISAHLFSPAQDQVVEHPLEGFVREPKEQRHHNSKRKNVARHLDRFFAAGPDHLFGFAPGVLGE